MLLNVIIFGYILLGVASENTTSTTDCQCNLSFYCDRDCCCDTNCTNEELLSFSCFQKTNRSEIIGCMQPIFRWNLKYPYEGYLKNGEFCIRKFIEEFSVPANTTSGTDLMDQSPLCDASKNFVLNNLIPSKSGDPVFVYHINKDSIERFSLPQMSDTSSPSPIAYLHDVNNTIKYPRDYTFLGDLSHSDLGSYQMLNISSHTDQLFIKNQIYLEQINETGDVSLAPNSSHALIYPNCTISNRNYSDCNLTRTEFSEGRCINLVAMAEYVIRYHDDGISRVSVQLTLADVSEVNDSISQRFVVLFRQANESLTPIVNSGHPGYLVGRPLITADLNVELKCQPFNGTELTLLSSPPDGICSTTSTRLPLQFGRNSLTGCSFDYNISSDEACRSSSSMARDNLLIGMPQFVSVNGGARSTPCQGDDWLPIVYSNDTSDNCSDVMVGLDVRVFYSNVGLFNHPLPLIVGMRVEFVKQNLTDCLICRESYCSPPTSVSVQLVSTLNFINLSKHPGI